MLAHVEAEFGDLKRRLEKRAEQRKIAQGVVDKKLGGTNSGAVEVAGASAATSNVDGKPKAHNKKGKYRWDEHTQQMVVDEHHEAVVDLAVQHGESIKMDEVLNSAVEATSREHEAAKARGDVEELDIDQEILLGNESALRDDVDIGDVRQLSVPEEGATIGAIMKMKQRPAAVQSANMDHDEIIRSHKAKWQRGKKAFLENIKDKYASGDGSPSPPRVRISGEDIDEADLPEIDATTAFSNYPKIRRVLRGKNEVASDEELEEDDADVDGDGSPSAQSPTSRKGLPTLENSNALDKHNLALTKKKLKDVQTQLQMVLHEMDEKQTRHAQRVVEIQLQHQLKLDSFKATYKDEIDALHKDNVNLEELTKKTREQLAEAKETLKTQAKEHADQVSELQVTHTKQISEKERAITHQKSRAEAAERDASSQKETIVELEEKVVVVTGQIVVAEQKQADQSDELSKQIEELQATLQERTAECQALTAETDSLKGHLTEEREKTDRLQQQLDNAESAKDALIKTQQEEINNLKAELADDGTGFSSVAGTNANSSTSSNMSVVGRRNAKNAELQQELDDLRSKNVRLTRQAEEGEEMRKQLDTVLAQFERQAEDLLTQEKQLRNGRHRRMQYIFLNYLLRKKIIQLSTESQDQRLQALIDENHWLHEQMRLKNRRHVKQKTPGTKPLVNYFEGDAPPTKTDDDFIFECDKAVQTVSPEEANCHWKIGVETAATQTNTVVEQQAMVNGLSVELAAYMHDSPIAAEHHAGGVASAAFEKYKVGRGGSDGATIEREIAKSIQRVNARSASPSAATGSVAAVGNDTDLEYYYEDEDGEDDVDESPRPAGPIGGLPPRPISAASTASTAAKEGNAANTNKKQKRTTAMVRSASASSTRSAKGTRQRINTTTRPQSGKRGNVASTTTSRPHSAMSTFSTTTNTAPPVGSNLPQSELFLVSGDAHNPIKHTSHPANYFVDRRRAMGHLEERKRRELSDHDRFMMLLRGETTNATTTSTGQQKQSAGEGSNNYFHVPQMLSRTRGSDGGDGGEYGLMAGMLPPSSADHNNETTTTVPGVTTTAAPSPTLSASPSCNDGWVPTSYAVGTMPVLTTNGMDEFLLQSTDGPGAFKPVGAPPSGAWRPRSASALRKFA